MLALLGSGALRHHTTDLRKPMDVDLLGRYDDIQEHIKYVSRSEKVLANYPSSGGTKIIFKTLSTIYEYDVAWEGSNNEALLRIIEEDSSTFKSDWIDGLCLVPSLDILYMLKMSHRYRKDSPHFKKTMDDIWRMRAVGATIPVQYSEWFAERESLTYTNKLPNLNQSRKEFFDNSNSIYTVQHDDIHEAVKHLDRPAYEYYKPDATEVFTSKEMFYSVDESVRLYGALEEVMVLSIERAILPFSLVGDKRRWAFDMAHMKLASSISGGWFRNHVWENYYAVQAMYSEEYVDKFYKALEAGQIKPFEETK